MAVQRALVVDDSKSARAFLARLLEEQQVQVDTAGSAEQAIEYLTKHSPDVIFMDHLMPGMDGFQAVQAIKSNPRTAAIPVLMYTSQEGELYLNQARALGAVGVLPKSVSAGDVRMVLQQLQADAQPAPADVVPQAADVFHKTDVFEVPVIHPPVAATVAAAGSAVEALKIEGLKEEVATLRRHVAEALDAHGRQVVGEMRSLIRDAMPSSAPAPAPEKPRNSPVPWLLALAAGMVAGVFGTLWWQGRQQLDGLANELMDSKSTIALLTARLAPAPQPDDVVVARVPFGEAPLSGARVEALREFVARVASLAQKGTVEVRRYAGRFCLAGSGAAGYSLADGAATSSSCDLVAEATDPALGSVAAESAAFTKALAELRKQHAAWLTIDVAEGQGEASGHAYPETGGAHAPSAGEWNAAAAENNRVEIRWHPAT